MPGWNLRPQDARGIGIGIEFVVSVMLGLGAGVWLDKRFHTGPWCTLVGIVLGFAAGLRSLIQWMNDENRKQAKAAPPKKPVERESDVTKGPAD